MTKRKKNKSILKSKEQYNSELKNTQKALHDCLMLLAEAYQRYGADAHPTLKRPWLTEESWEIFMTKLIKIQRNSKYVPDEMFD